MQRTVIDIPDGHRTVIDIPDGSSAHAVSPTSNNLSATHGFLDDPSTTNGRLDGRSTRSRSVLSQRFMHDMPETLTPRLSEETEGPIVHNTGHTHGHDSRPPSIASAIASAVINFMLMFGLCCAYGMIMFTADHNKRHHGLAVKMNICTAFITGFWLAVFSSVPVAIGGPDLNPVVFVGDFVETLAEQIAKDLDLKYPDLASKRRLASWEWDEHAPRSLGSQQSDFCVVVQSDFEARQCDKYHEELRATAIFTVATFTASLGLIYFSMGRLRLTRLVRYLPSSITEAFLSCIGYKVFKYALKFSEYDARQFLPAACIGAPLYFLKAMHIGNPAIVMPLGLLLPLGVFYGTMYLTDSDFDPIKNEKVMFPEIPNVEFWRIWTDSIGKYDKINFTAWTKTLPEMAVALVVVTLDCVLKISATEEKLPLEPDKDYEATLYGVANFFNTICGASVGYMQLKFNVINYGVMGNTTDRRGGLIYATMCGAVFFSSTYVFNYMPRFFVTTLLFFAGSGFVAENLWGSRKFLSFMEWLEILMIIAVFVITGQLLYAVAAGILLTGFSFIRKYASVPVLCCPPLTGRDIDTRERRNPLVQRTVNHISGNWLLVLRLKGFVFFGSANTLTTFVMHRIQQDNIKMLPEYQRLQFVCLDCEFLDGLDASAGKTISKMIKDARKENVLIIWSHLSQAVQHELQRREILGFDTGGTQWFPDLDAAVLFVENRCLKYLEEQQQKWLGLHPAFLREQMRRERQAAFEPFRHIFLFDGPRVGCPWRYCQPLQVPKNTLLWSQNEPSQLLFLVHSGSVGVFSARPSNAKSWNSPLAIYHHGFFLNIQALANAPCKNCAVALEETWILYWDTAQWRVMAREQPLMMHEIMRAVLKQQAYDDIADSRVADNLHMDMDNHDWEAFEDLVDGQAQTHRVARLRKSVVGSDVLSLLPRRPTIHPAPAPGAQDDDSDDSSGACSLGVHRVGNWGADDDEDLSSLRRTFSGQSTGRSGRTSHRSDRGSIADPPLFARGIAHLPQELQIRVPALQTAQALWKLGFYDASGDSGYLEVPLPKELVEDLHISFKTFAGEYGLPWSLVPSALMYAGIFDKPQAKEMNMTGVVSESVRKFLRHSEALRTCSDDSLDVGQHHQKDVLDEEDFMALGQDMLMAKLPERQVTFIKDIFNKYCNEDDGAGRLDVSEISRLFEDNVHPNVSSEEIESLAEAWAHDATGKIDLDAFIAIVSRFVRKHKQDYYLFNAFREILGTDVSEASRYSVFDVVRRFQDNGQEITEDEAKEMCWAASVTNRPKDDQREVYGVDFHNLMSTLFVLLTDKGGKLPPPPQCEKHAWPTPPDLEILSDCPEAKEYLAMTRTSAGLKVDHDYPISYLGRLHLLLEDPTSSREAMYLAVVMLIIILLSVLVLLLEPLISGPDKKKHGATEKKFWTLLEIVFTVIFCIELLLRMCTAHALPNRTFLTWLSDPATLVDIAAVLPYFTDLLLDSAGDSFKVLRVIRMLRIGRVMRISRMAKLTTRMFKSKKTGILQPSCVVLIVIWGIYLKNSPDMK